MADDLEALFGAIRARLEELGPQAGVNRSYHICARSADGRRTQTTIRIRGECPFQSVFTSPSRSAIRSVERRNSSSTAARRSARTVVVTCLARMLPSIGLSAERLTRRFSGPAEPAAERHDIRRRKAMTPRSSLG